jgi:two-component system, cell cycle response regulator DivK
MTSILTDPVLLIDDHDDTRQLMVELLELEGYPVVSVSTGGQALAAISGLRPCLIFLDLGLPDIFGLELARRLRAQPEAANTPLYALSGFSNLRAEALAAGCDGFLLKPLLPTELRQVVRGSCGAGQRKSTRVA